MMAVKFASLLEITVAIKGRLTALPLIRNIWISPFPRVVSSDFRLIRGDRDLPIFLKAARASKMHQTRLASMSRKSFRAKSWKFVICRAIAHWWFLVPVMKLPSPQAMKAFGSC